MTDAAVGLADAIKALREELMIAVTEGEGEPVHFRLAPIELSLQVTVTKGAEGKIGWHVLGVGASLDSASTQTLKLRLDPVTATEDGAMHGDFTVSDRADKMPRVGPQDKSSR